MADNSDSEKKPVLKSIFQWAAAFTAPIACEAPQRSYDAAGYAYDYLKAKVSTTFAPKAG